MPSFEWSELRRLASACVDDPIEEMLRLRHETRGWVVRDDASGMRVFVSDAEPDFGGEPYV